MCVAAFAWKADSQYRLVLAGNRDEFHARPADAACWWSAAESRDPHDQHSELFGGRDRQAGGTWLGVNRLARFATVTNFRAAEEFGLTAAKSRGDLITGSLRSPGDMGGWFSALANSAMDYAGFNLIGGDRESLYYATNRHLGRQSESNAVAVSILEPGIHGVSNGRLNSDWPKLNRLKSAVARSIDQPLEHSTPPQESGDAVDAVAETQRVAELFDVLADRATPPDEALPDTGVGIEMERLVAPVFICSPTYGTRAGTVVLIGYDDRIRFVERQFDADGRLIGEIDEAFVADAY